MSTYVHILAGFRVKPRNFKSIGCSTCLSEYLTLYMNESETTNDIQYLSDWAANSFDGLQ